MMIGRKIAALGASTAALAMLTGLAGARADELSDLRLNQQLLSQRIDQLAAVGQKTGNWEMFSVDTNPAASAPATAGSFPRSILIPGTDTSLKVYGQITEVIDYWMSGGTPNGSPQSTTVGDNGQVQSLPLDKTSAAGAHARSAGIFQQSPRESKIGFETRTPTPFGEARTVMEFDWAGSSTFVPGGTNPTSVSDNLVPRLRYAYGTLGGFLAGQATSNFSDPDANAETLDFGGNVGEPGRVRVPQVRYTVPVAFGGSFSVSAETPETDIGTGAGVEGSDAGVIPTVTTTCTVAALATATPCTTALLTSGQLPVNIAKSVAPDLTAAWYLPQAWGHLDVSAVIRPGLDVTDGKFFARDFIGYGGHFGLDFKPGWFGWVKDDFTAHFTLGEALGNYLNSSTNFALATNYGTGTGATGTYGAFGGPATAAAAASILVKPTFEWGSEIGYQHWWADNLRSNINAGFNAHQIPAAVVGAAQSAAMNKELLTAHANLIWNPVSSVDVGIEYMWGQRTVVNNNHGTENALISKLAFRF
jgi:porin-like protein